MPQQHSPLKSPCAGDVVRAENGVERHVKWVEWPGPTITYSVWTIDRKTGKRKPGKSRNCWIVTWQDWCSKNKAVVVTVGKAGEG